MKELSEKISINKNVSMLSITLLYILGLYGYFTDEPIIFSAIVTVLAVLTLIRTNRLKYAVVMLSIFYTGFYYADYRVKESDGLYDRAPCESVLVGQISSVPSANGDGRVKFFFDVTSMNDESIKGKTMVTVRLYKKQKPSDPEQFLIGNTYKIRGKLRKPFTATNPSQFSYEKYLKNFGIFTTFYTEEENVTQTPNKLTIKNKILQYMNVKRENVITSHSRYLQSPNIEILGGVVFGDDAIAPPDTIKTSFIHSGLLHILAASGMNVAFIAGFLFFFLDHLKVPFKLRTICGIVTVIFYALMTGLGASVVRAALMLIFVLVGKLIDRDAHSVALLSFVALLMLIYNPAYINDVGFQLSFIVTFGIMISADPVQKYVKSLPNWLSASIFIPIIAQIWVIPIQMFYFNTISIYSVFANILTMPFLSVISFGGFISSVFALCPSIADMVCRIFDFVINPCLNVLVYISNYFANCPHSLYTTTHPSIIQILVYYIILLAIVYLLKIEFKNKKVILSTFSLILLLYLSTVLHLPNTNFEVITFDVGNADAFLLKTPANKYYIIDTGKMGYDGGKSQAEIIILKYLKDKGIKDIEGIILTHYDSDHAGGTIDLINNLRIKKLYVNTIENRKRLARLITTSARNNNIPKIVPKDGEVICREKDFILRVIKPNLVGTDAQKSDNENSVITLAQYKKNTMLFTGDAGVRALSRAKLPNDITILKAGHHGARGVINKELMDYLNPRASIVSVGYNKYGHPSPVTIKLLEQSKVLRTDKINSIRIKFTSDNRYEVESYNPRTHKFYTRFQERL